MRADPHRAALFRGAASDGGARRAAADGRRRPLPAAPRRGAGGALDPLPHAGLLPAYRCGGERGGDAARSDPGDAADHDVGAAGPGARQGRRRRVDGAEEAGGVFLMTDPVYVTDAMLAEAIEDNLAARNIAL